MKSLFQSRKSLLSFEVILLSYSRCIFCGGMTNRRIDDKLETRVCRKKPVGKVIQETRDRKERK